MITGFNTDIEYNGVIYHVQTEDKGLDSPLILSLVYSGGAILASKRSPYEDLIASGFDEAELAARLKRQHRLICAAINSGRLDDLKKMGRPDEKVETATSQTTAPVVEEPVSEPESQEPGRIEIEETEQPSSVESKPLEPEPFEIEREAGSAESSVVDESVAEDATVETPGPTDDIQALLVSNASDYAALAEATPPPSVPEPSPEPPPPTPPEQVRRPRRPPDSQLYSVHDARRQLPIRNAGKIEKGMVVTILDEEEFRAGQIFNIRVLVENRNEAVGKPLGGVSLSVKILGTAFRPQLYTVKTGRDGVAVISAHIPLFTSGRAAILIRAESDGKAVETRRVIYPAF